jgi:hypothetical protein
MLKGAILFTKFSHSCSIFLFNFLIQTFYIPKLIWNQKSEFLLRNDFKLLCDLCLAAYLQILSLQLPYSMHSNVTFLLLFFFFNSWHIYENLNLLNFSICLFLILGCHSKQLFQLSNIIAWECLPNITSK